MVYLLYLNFFLTLGIFIVGFVWFDMVHWVCCTLTWYDVRGGRYSFVGSELWDIVEVIIRWVLECFWDSSPAKGAGIGCHDWVRIVAAMVWKMYLLSSMAIFGYQFVWFLGIQPPRKSHWLSGHLLDVTSPSSPQFSWIPPTPHLEGQKFPVTFSRKLNTGRTFGLSWWLPIVPLTVFDFLVRLRRMMLCTVAIFLYLKKKWGFSNCYIVCLPEGRWWNFEYFVLFNPELGKILVLTAVMFFKRVETTN